VSRLAAWAGLTVGGFLVFGTFLHFPGSLDDVGLAPAGVILGGLTGCSSAPRSCPPFAASFDAGGSRWSLQRWVSR
jgi:hypothetical protein